MIPERLAKMEATLRNSANIPEATRRELLDLVAGLQAEVGPLVETHAQAADGIADRAQAAVEAAVHRDEHPDKAVALEGLAASVRQFEATHPRLVEVVDRLALTLSNMGI
jgi:hypothetical protein